MKLWVVGQNKKQTEYGIIWEMQGVFSSEDKALEICKGHPTYFIGMVELDVPFPDETVDFPGCYYPIEKQN